MGRPTCAKQFACVAIIVVAFCLMPGCEGPTGLAEFVKYTPDSRFILVGEQDLYGWRCIHSVPTGKTFSMRGHFVYENEARNQWVIEEMPSGLEHGPMYMVTGNDDGGLDVQRFTQTETDWLCQSHPAGAMIASWDKIKVSAHCYSKNFTSAMLKSEPCPKLLDSGVHQNLKLPSPDGKTQVLIHREESKGFGTYEVHGDSSVRLLDLGACKTTSLMENEQASSEVAQEVIVAPVLMVTYTPLAFVAAMFQGFPME